MVLIYDGTESLQIKGGASPQVLIVTGLKSGGLQASDVTYMAVHGTGTPLGDPIEIGALGQALTVKASRQHETAQRLTFGSVKACFGHTEGTAGLTGTTWPQIVQVLLTSIWLYYKANFELLRCSVYWNRFVFLHNSTLIFQITRFRSKYHN